MGAERRLLVITESLGVGGTESHLLRLLPRLSTSGWKVATFCLSGRGERADELESKGIEVLSASGFSRRKKSDRRHPAFIARAASSLFWFERRWRPHIAHFYLPGPYVVGAPIAIANATPLKIMSRRSLSVYQQKWPIVAGIERILHKKMDALVGNSRAVVTQLLEEGAPERKVRLIYNGLEVLEPLTPRSEARRALGLDENTLVGVVVANLIHYKGHEDLIRSLGQVAQQLPSPWQVLLVGRDEGLRGKLESLVYKEGIVANIQFLGQRSDVPSVLAAADFGLLTSHEEGFSNVILEGMAAALPMIVTNVGGNPEAVLNEETGLVVPPRNPHAIGEAILRLARDTELRRRMGAAGRDRVRQEFSMHSCAEAHAELYEELLFKVRQRGAYVGKRAARLPSSARSERPLMLAYWGRYGALPQFTLELAHAAVGTGQATPTTISVASSNELFKQYFNLGEAIFPVETYFSPSGALNVSAVMRLRRNLNEKLSQDGTRAFVTLMPHIWSPLTTPMLRRLGIRHTVIVHDADPHLGDRTALINRWLLREARSADQVVTLTEAVARRLTEGYGIPETKICVLFHPELTYQTPRAIDVPPGPLRVLFFGRILPYKGLDLFVGAMESLKRAGVPLQIGVFGSGAIGPEHDRLKALGAEVVNKWIDPADVAGIFARHDVVVVSHTAASQSGVIAAAHGAGLPVIATPVGGLREQVIPGVTGIVTANITADAIAVAVRRFTEDRKLFLSMRQGINATRRERSIECFFGALSKVALKGI